VPLLTGGPLVTPPPPPGPTPNLPTPFQPREGGPPVPTGEGFGVEAVNPPKLEWWRGAGARGVVGVVPPAELGAPALPRGPLPFEISGGIKGQAGSLGLKVQPRPGVITGEGEGPTAPAGKRRAQFESSQRAKYSASREFKSFEKETTNIRPTTYEREYYWARRAMEQGWPKEQVKTMFKTRTGKEFPE